MADLIKMTRASNLERLLGILTCRCCAPVASYKQGGQDPGDCEGRGKACKLAKPARVEVEGLQPARECRIQYDGSDLHI